MADSIVAVTSELSTDASDAYCAGCLSCSDVRGAGTDANISIELHGDKVRV